MPHYVDGTEAHVGDIVRGKGYNLKNEAGELREIVGVAVAVTPDATACNITVLIPGDRAGYIHLALSGESAVTGYALTGITEYGQTDHFEKVS